jgi:hypothetical protein
VEAPSPDPRVWEEQAQHCLGAPEPHLFLRRSSSAGFPSLWQAMWPESCGATAAPKPGLGCGGRRKEDSKKRQLMGSKGKAGVASNLGDHGERVPLVREREANILFHEVGTWRSIHTNETSLSVKRFLFKWKWPRGREQANGDMRKICALG